MIYLGFDSTLNNQDECKLWCGRMMLHRATIGVVSYVWRSRMIRTVISRF